MQTLAERTAHWLEGSPRKSRWKVASEPEFSTDERLIPDLSGRDSRRASVTGFKRLPAAGFVLKSWQKKGGTAIIRPLQETAKGIFDALVCKKGCQWPAFCMA